MILSIRKDQLHELERGPYHGWVASLSALCGLSLAQAAFGAVTARISGIVKDPTGAVVPAAQVRAVLSGESGIPKG